MLHTMFQKLKDVLPPAVSFKLRTFKSGLVDRDLQDLIRFAKAVGGPNTHAVDIGGNYGIYSAALSSHFGRVVVIEPNPECVDYMRQVLPSRCEVISKAISDSEGRTTLRIPIVSGSSESTRATISAQNAFDDLDLSGTKEVEVSVQSIDGLAREGAITTDRVRLIKIDVEGHELMVLKGATNVLRAAKPSICIEMERRHGTHVNAALELLHEFGYQAVRFEAGRYVIDRSSATASEGAVNLFLLHRDKMPEMGIQP